MIKIIRKKFNLDQKNKYLQNVQEKVSGSNPNCPQVCVSGSVRVPKIKIQTKAIIIGTVN